MSQVYLICFDKYFHHAKHYIGFTKKGIEHRLKTHRSGQGARLLRALVKADIGFNVSRVWDDKDRNFERKLKNQKNAKHYCPWCEGKYAD